MNELDKAKLKKFRPLSEKQKQIQKDYFFNWVQEMQKRKEKGDEKYGNYMMEVNKNTALKELREEFLDCCNHLVMLMFRIEGVKQLK